jgi:hypothetical protein
MEIQTDIWEDFLVEFLDILRYIRDELRRLANLYEQQVAINSQLYLLLTEIKSKKDLKKK